MIPHEPTEHEARVPPERRSAALERRALDRRVRAVVEGMSDAFLALDRDWRVVYANREAARLNGVPAAELAGVNHWERWPETVGSDVEEAYRRAVRDGVPVQLEHYYPASGLWHEIRAFPTEEGGLAVFYRDVTAQKRLEAERERQAKALATAHDQAMQAELQVRLLVDRVQDYAVFLMGPDGVITRWGEGARRIKGWTAAEAIGMHLSQLYPPGGTAEDGSADEHLRIAAELGEYVGEGTRLRRGKTPFIARVTLTALRRGGELVGFSKITQDLTTERRREEALVAAMAAARAASDAKSQFLANTSHEIRTPLNAVMGYAELLELELAGPLAPSQRQYLARIQETSRHLLTLINDVLDLSRIEAGEMRTTREPGLVHDVVAAALRVIEPQARARGVQLANACAADPPTAYDADGERVRQILVNLLSNAVRFTEAHGRVTVSCGTAPTAPADAEVVDDGPFTYVRVEDTGIGIPSSQLERIWEAFVQVEGGRTRRVGGSGLGLTISRHLARLMGGDITARSQIGLGSTFTLWLPGADAAQVRAVAPLHVHVVGADAPVELMPRTGEIVAAAVATMEEPPPGLSAIADALLAETERVLAMYTARLRNDDRTPSAHGLTDEALQDHGVTFLADLAQSLTVAANDGPEAMAMLSDASAIQRLIAVRHGAQRARLGWGEAEVRREYEILLEEVLGAVRRRMTRGGQSETQRAAELLTLFIRAAERHSLEAFARERAGADPDGAAE
jgi:PAS domain S-box-containing protein